MFWADLVYEFQSVCAGPRYVCFRGALEFFEEEGSCPVDVRMVG